MDECIIDRGVRVWKDAPENFRPHVEVAACYVEVEGKLLLLKRSGTGSEGKTWGVPAGKIESGETPLQAAIRELSEEAGVHVASKNVQEIGKLYIQKPKGSYVYHMFQVKMDAFPKVVLNAEHTEHLWASEKEIETLPLIGGAKEALLNYKEMKSSIQKNVKLSIDGDQAEFLQTGL